MDFADAVTAIFLDTVKRYRNMGYDVHYIPNAIDLKDLSREAIRLYDKQIIYVRKLLRERV